MHLPSEVQGNCRRVGALAPPEWSKYKEVETAEHGGVKMPRRITHHGGPQAPQNAENRRLRKLGTGLAHGRNGKAHNADMKVTLIHAGVNGSLQLVKCVGWSKAVGLQPLATRVT